MTQTFPSKTYAIGEYILIHQGPALIITTPPFFQVSEQNNAQGCPFHPKSPAGRYWQAHPDLHHRHFAVEQPLAPYTGLGASGAEFMACWASQNQLAHWTPEAAHACWKDYQDLISNEPCSPSGSDVLAQGLRGMVHIDYQRAQGQSLGWTCPNLGYVLWHQHRHLATHEHIAALGERFESLRHSPLAALMRQQAEEGCQAWQAGHDGRWLEALNGFAWGLEAMGFVADHTRTLLNQIRRWPETLVAKGCGAMGAETLMIWACQKDIPHILERCQALEGQVVAHGQTLA